MSGVYVTKSGHRRLDLTNDRYGRLVVIAPGPDVPKHRKWHCRCDCGRTSLVFAGALRSGKTRSCGCLHREIVRKRRKHEGLSKKEINRAASARLRDRRKLNGVCMLCGHARPKDQCTVCQACLDRQKEYNKSRRSQRNAAHTKYRRKLRAAAFDAYGGPRCACCGESTPEFLGIDHTQGDGNKHRRQIGNKGGHSMYLWLKKNGYPEGFQVLCHNCNFAKGHFGYCPHKVGSRLA